ncbi:phage tail length tape measure family protein [Pelomonas sp. Root1444]|uniref:phage tail length tape measure family protein n=1 Tax=Pelomonas sp. Root1444 TaxID=1736464 RepID=UPI0007025748|nr:phage tail length tape measure family protein [Pelomonas sp. Root1444]KQY83649.1 hypothetical protein ASD35_24300 [Pelomonas sp. Root1444]
MEDLKIRLVLEGAEQVQTSANKAADGLGKLGKAGQQAGQQAQLSGQQMAQVSAQLQDLFVQIQGGQAPITALLQQGSQLSAVFGGVGNALRAVGGLITPTVAILGAAGVAIGGVALAYKQGTDEAKAYTNALVLSGNAVGVTVGQLRELAAAQSRVVGTQGEAAQALAALVATGRVSADALDEAAEAATRFARAGIPIEETVKKFASLGKDPLKALIDLNEAENFLTEAVYRQVKSLVEQGKTAEAAKVAMAAYAAEGVRRAKELEASLTGVEKAFKVAKDGAAGFWDAIVDSFRPSVIEGKVAELRNSIGGVQQLLNMVTGRTPVQAAISLVQPSNTEGAEAAARRVAKAEGERAAAVKAAIEADEKAAEAAKKLARARDEENAAVERALGLSGSYQKDLTELLKLRQLGRLTEEQYIKAVENLIKVQPVVRDQLEAQAAAQKKAADALNDLLQAEQRRIDAVYKGADQTAAQVLKLQEEEKAITLSAASHITLAEAIERVAIARVEDAHAKATAQNDFGTAAALRAEVEQREKLATLIGRKETRDTAKRSAEDAAREWKRATEEMERSLTDSLMRGFENGKGFAQNLRDTIVNMFKTMVLRPVVQAVFKPVTNALTGWLQGLMGSGGSSGASLGQLISTAGTFFNSSWLSSIGASLGGGAAAASAASAAGAAGAGAGGLMGAASAAGPLAAMIAMFMGAADSAYANGFNQDNFSYTKAWFQTGGLAPPTVKFDTNALVKLGVNERIANVITGASLWSRAFGHSDPQIQGQGISGTVNAGGFAGQAYADWIKKGGWFHSDKTGTDRMPISSSLDAELDRTVGAVYKSAAEYAKVLGLPVSAVNGYAAQFKVVWGKTEEENKAALDAAISNLGEQLASRYAAQLAPLQRYGETMAATLERLSTLQTFTNGLGALGGVFSRLAATSVTAREHLIDLAGGMDALGQQALGFAQNYYNRDEIAGLKAREVQAALGQAGVTPEVNSREQFRALVESLDPNSTTGREQLAALLALQGSFATVSDYLAETGLTLSQAAALAPANDMLSPLLSTVSQQLQLAQQSMDAQYETRDATLKVADMVQQLANAILSGGGGGGGWVPGYRQPEVTTAG